MDRSHAQIGVDGSDMYAPVIDYLIVPLQFDKLQITQLFYYYSIWQLFGNDNLRIYWDSSIALTNAKEEVNIPGF